tara:strand:- start:1481 stop:1753 length:273 start_codon:yes stop_codon:yes gene_type:complete
MNGNEKDWWDSSPEEDEWVWIGGDNEEDSPKSSHKLKTYAVQYKADTMKSVEVDGFSERDAIKQVMDEHKEEETSDDITIISVIEVNYDE